MFDIAYVVLFAFLCSFIHELCHLLCAIILGERPVRITIMPYGCRLSMYTIKSDLHEVLIALAGPMFNLFAFLLSSDGPFREMNLCMLLINLLPVSSLDGGRVLSVIFIRLFGPFRAVSVMRIISRSLACVTLLSGAYVLYASGFNLSLFIIGLFLCADAFFDKSQALRTYKVMIMSKEKLPHTKSVLKAFELVANSDAPARLLLSHIPFNKYFFVSVIDDNGRILGRISERELTEKIALYGARIKLGELFKNS